MRYQNAPRKQFDGLSPWRPNIRPFWYLPAALLSYLLRGEAGKYQKRSMPPSANRQRVYRAIVEYALAHGGQSPTIRELQELLEISSTSVVSYHLHALIELGWSEVVDRKLVVVGSTWTPPQEG